MNPNIFRKGEATSVLVPEKSWNEVLDKPANLDAVAERVVAMLLAANGMPSYTVENLVADVLEVIRQKTEIPGEYVLPALNAVVEVYEDMVDGTFDSRAEIVDAVEDALSAFAPAGSSVDEAVSDIFGLFLKADGERYLGGGDTLGDAKDVINNVLVTPLLQPVDSNDPSSAAEGKTISVDAFWDEIEGAPNGLREAIERAYQMKLGIGNYVALGDSSGLGDVKYVLNNAVLEPLKGEVEYD